MGSISLFVSRLLPAERSLFLLSLHDHDEMSSSKKRAREGEDDCDALPKAVAAAAPAEAAAAAAPAAPVIPAVLLYYTGHGVGEEGRVVGVCALAALPAAMEVAAEVSEKMVYGVGEVPDGVWAAQVAKDGAGFARMLGSAAWVKAAVEKDAPAPIIVRVVHRVSSNPHDPRPHYFLGCAKHQDHTAADMVHQFWQGVSDQYALVRTLVGMCHCPALVPKPPRGRLLVVAQVHVSDEIEIESD